MHIVCFTKKCLASGLNLLYYTVYYILPYTIYYIFLLACRLGISIRAAARNHNIPEATLRHKISGYHPVSKKMGPPMLLTDAEEKVLVNYILLSCDRARPVTKHNILNARERSPALDPQRRAVHQLLLKIQTVAPSSL